MYTSYSTLQRKQLSKQVYTDTQSTYLLVYAPGRHKALQAALQNQLHRKFRLVTQLEDELTPDVAGVLLVSEDVECTPTALTYFAAALREGADLAVCDASFGFDGSTALYLSTQHLPGSRCALVSRALLDKVRAAARGRDSVTELLRLAKENGLLITGGTDYHGIHTVTPRPVGAFTTHDEQIARLNDLAKARKSTFKRTT